MRTYQSKCKAKELAITAQPNTSLMLFAKITFTLACLCLLSACGRSEPTSFFLLESKTASPTFEYSEKSKRKMPKIILEQVAIPAYLDRTSLINRENAGVKVEISEFNSWAESLDGGIQRILGDVLLGTLLKEDVLLIPINNDVANARKLFVFIQRFDGQLNGHVALDARWTLHNTANEAVASGAFAQTAPAGATFASMVAAQSSLLVQFAEHISKPIAKAARRR